MEQQREPPNGGSEPRPESNENVSAERPAVSSSRLVRHRAPRNSSKLHEQLAQLAELAGGRPQFQPNDRWQEYTIPDLIAHLRKRIAWYRTQLEMGKLSDA